MKIKTTALLLSAVFLASSAAFTQEEETGLTIQTSSNPAADQTKNNLQPAGQVVWVSGTVKATYPEQTARILARGAVIYEKDTIVTDKGSGQISFSDNSMLTLNPETTLVIEQYYFNQQKPEQGGQSVMNLIKGGLRTVTGFVAKASPANYQMKTPVGTIGVRGTDYQAACQSNPGPCAFALLRGLGITISNQAGVFNVTPQTPFASVVSTTTSAVISKVPSEKLGATPTITPANAPPPTSNSGGGNCGIIIH